MLIRWRSMKQRWVDTRLWSIRMRKNWNQWKAIKSRSYLKRKSYSYSKEIIRLWKIWRRKCYKTSERACKCTTLLQMTNSTSYLITTASSARSIAQTIKNLHSKNASTTISIWSVSENGYCRHPKRARKKNLSVQSAASKST